MTQIHNFSEAHKALSKYISRYTKPGSYLLGHMQKLMESLGNPQNTFKVVHVAGTSGKTSTCYYVASLLQAAGQKVGLTVSPHVDEVNERVQIDLVSMPEQKFCRKLSEFLDIVDKTGIKVTYFELLIAFAYWHFAAEKVDYAVIEVGLGGLLDATNVITNNNKLCVITDIGLDHINVLGDTLAKIAAQKAGIIQKQNQVFMYCQSGEVMHPISERCGQMQAELYALSSTFEDNLTDNLPPFQRRNWHLAKEVFDFVSRRDRLEKISSKQLAVASQAQIPARLEVVDYQGKTLIIDGSHNEQKMAAAVEGVQKLFAGQSVTALVSFVQSKHERVDGALKQLRKLTDSIIVTSFSGEQDTPKHSVDPKIIASTANKLGFTNISIVYDPADAFAKLVEQSEEILLVTGSFYLLNHIRPLIFRAAL